MGQDESAGRLSAPLITLVLPYYNEADYIAATLRSLAEQSDRRFKLVLVDNASTDFSAQLARQSCETMGDIEVAFLDEQQPGKIFALRTGIAAAQTRFVATLDADTIYPADYVRRILQGFASHADAVAVLAFDRPLGSPPRASARQWLFADYLPKKCHTGGFGQAFDAKALGRCGGFDPVRWPYVLEDHEIIARIGKLGSLVYSDDHVCFPSDRRTDRSDCNWSLSERVLYKLVPSIMLDWFFYSFLAKRFERRGLRNIKLRDQTWQADSAQSA